MLSVHIAQAATGSVTLRWTSPGDDGRVGRAVAYDVRYSLAPITAANFRSATQATGAPTPMPAGELEVFKITNLVAGVGYYFALETVDDAQNWSTISNVGFATIGATTASVELQALSLSAPWPNPARGSVHWTYTLAEPAALDIEAYSIDGARVRTIAHTLQSAGSGEVGWDLRDDRGRQVEPGVYMIRARLGAKRWVRRLVVAH
jgi:hypothetical protein